MLGAVEWTSLLPAGAFVLGAIVGSVATLHAVRSAVTLFERRRREDEPRR